MGMARRLLLVGAILLVSVVSAGAAQTDEARFLGILKTFGISLGPIQFGATESEKPCVCTVTGGNKLVGLLTINRTPGDFYSFECTIPRFDNTGAAFAQAGCTALNGTITVIDQ
jgi:hypothetical protein